MKREILFKGKIITSKKWIEGDLLHKYWYYGDIFQDCIRYLIDGIYSYPIPIDPETVCQFTGLIDKNGKRIFEGDIIRLEDIICPITWHNGCFQMITDKNSGISAAIQDRTKRFEVIGNIYDNPELLNQSK